MTDNPKKPPLHLASWAAQDWRTSRPRMRSITTGDPWLRVVYFEALNALQEAGGELTADPEALSDVLGAPAPEVARCLPILDRIARVPGSRGGLLVEDGKLTNRRVSEAFTRDEEFRKEQAERGRQGGLKAGKGRNLQAPVRRNEATAKPPPMEKGADLHLQAPAKPPLRSDRQPPNHPYPFPLPSPLPLSVSVPVAVGERSGVAGEGVGGVQLTPLATHASAPGTPNGDNHGDGTDTSTTYTDTDLRAAIDHDPNDELQSAIVERCVHLAKVEAWRDDRQATPADVLGILHVVSTTPNEKHLEGLRHASRSWLDQTLRASEVFEREISDDGERAPPDGST